MVTKEPTYREILKDIYGYMTDQFKQENENIVVLYYYSLACLLMKKFDNCLEALRLVQVLHELNYISRRAVAIDYYKTKSENIESLVRTLIQQRSSF